MALETFKNLAEAVKGKFGLPFNRAEVLSRESIVGIHPGDSIRFVNSAELFTVTGTNPEGGLVWSGTEKKIFFETNQQVIIFCPGRKGHKLVK
jgi:hypothetical protein